MADYYWVIAATLVGFAILAFVLLWPVYKHLRREERLNALLDEQEKEQAASGTDMESPARPNGRQ